MRSVVIMAGLMILALSGATGEPQGGAADRSQTGGLKGLQDQADTARRCYLVRQGVPQAALVVGEEAGTLTWRAARVFADLARQWLRADLPILTDRDWRHGVVPEAEQSRNRSAAYVVIGDARRNKSLSEKSKCNLSVKRFGLPCGTVKPFRKVKNVVYWSSLERV